MKKEHIVALLVVLGVMVLIVYLTDSGTLSDALNGILGNSDGSDPPADPASGGSADMQFSAQSLAQLAQLEGTRLTAYWDVNGWAIGNGSHYYPDGTPVQEGDTITADQVPAITLGSVSTIENWINENVTADLTQNQFDALVLWIYSIGTSAASGSTLLQLLNSGDVAGAAQQFGRWVYETVDGVKVQASALVNRETLITNLFNSGGN